MSNTLNCCDDFGGSEAGLGLSKVCRYFSDAGVSRPIYNRQRIRSGQATEGQQKLTSFLPNRPIAKHPSIYFSSLIPRVCLNPTNLMLDLMQKYYNSIIKRVFMCLQEKCLCVRSRIA